MAVVDLLAIVLFYLPFLGVDARFLFRLVRILRLAKLKRYLYTLRLLRRVWRSKRHEIIFTTALMLLLVSASLMYYVEHAYQPDTFGSIPQHPAVHVVGRSNAYHSGIRRRNAY